MIAATPVGVPLLHRGDSASPVSVVRRHCTHAPHSPLPARAEVASSQVSLRTTNGERVVLHFRGMSVGNAPVSQTTVLRTASLSVAPRMLDASSVTGVACSPKANLFVGDLQSAAFSSRTMLVDVRTLSSLRESMRVVYRMRRSVMCLTIAGGHLAISASAPTQSCENSRSESRERSSFIEMCY